MRGTYARGQAPRYPRTRRLQTQSLKRERTPIRQLQKETASPQRQTQEP